MTDERDTTAADLRKLTLDKPVREMLERVALDPDLFAMKFGTEFEFVQGADGVEIHNKDGEIPLVTPEGGKPREATFTEADIQALCDASEHKDSYDRLLVGSRATGGGAGGSKGAPAPVRADKPTPAPAAVRFGLQ